MQIDRMEESGIDLGFDLKDIISDDFDLVCSDLMNQEEAVSVPSSQNDFMFYELKSKTVPERQALLYYATEIIVSLVFLAYFKFNFSSRFY